MSESARRAAAWLAPAAALAVWAFWGAPRLTRLPERFSYRADVFSRDDFFDPRERRFTGDGISFTRFNVDAEGRRDGALLLRCVFDVSRPAGGKIISIRRLYGVDRRSWRHRPGLGDKPREGFLFAPRGARGRPYDYWHPNYDAPVRMTRQGEEHVLGLRLLRYAASFTADQTADLGHLPGVPGERGVETDVRLEAWVEPASGWLVKFEDSATAWFYDPRTRRRLHPWNRFRNQPTEASVAEHVRRARAARRRALWAGPWGAAAWAALSLLWWSWLSRRRFAPLVAAVERAARRRRSGRWPRRAALAGGLAGLALLAALYSALVARETAQVHRLLALEAQRAADRAGDHMAARILALKRMAQRWESAGGTPPAVWEKDAARHVRDFPGFQAVSWSDASLRVRRIVPLEGNEAAVGMRTALDEARRRALDEARRTREPVVSRPIDLVQGGRGFVVHTPLHLADGRFDGFMTGVFRYDTLMDVLTRDIGAQGHAVSLKDGDETVYARGPTERLKTEWAAEKDVRFPGGAWKLAIVPRPEWVGWVRSPLPEATLAAGAAVLLLGALCLAMAGVAARRTLLLRRALAAGRAREARFKDFLDGAPDAVVVADAAGRIVLVNVQTERLFGYARAELLGRPVEVLVPDRFKSRHPAHREGYVAAPRTRAMGAGLELSARRKDGAEFPVEISLAPLQGEDGPLVMSAIRDVTAQREVQRTLAAQGEALKSQRTAALNLARDAQEARLKAEAAERVVRAGLKEKEVLLKEVHHRVKNNLQVIASLLNMQSHQVKDPRDLALFRESQYRVRSMALVHQKLYQAKDMARVDFAEYLGHLAEDLFRAHRMEPGQVSLRASVDVSHLEVDTAVPLALIVNELLSNALKHAFPGGRRGQVAVTLAPAEAGLIRLTVSDDGAGLPDGLDWEAGPSLGLQIVRDLSRQLEGRLEIAGKGGTRVTLTFPASRS